MSRSARSGLPTMGGTTGNSAVGDLLDLTGTGGGEGGDTLDLNGRHLPPLPPSCHNTAPLSSSAASLDRFYVGMFTPFPISFHALLVGSATILSDLLVISNK